MNRFFLFLIVVSCISIDCCYAQGTQLRAQVDSLENALRSVDNPDRMVILRKLVQLTENTDPEKKRYYLDLYKSEANRIKDYDAIVFSMIWEYNALDELKELEQILQLGKAAEAIAREHHLYRYLYHIQMNMVTIMCANSLYDKSLKKAQSMYDEARESNDLQHKVKAINAFCFIYSQMSRPDECIQYANDGLALLKEANEPVAFDHLYFYEILSDEMFNASRYQECIVYADSMQYVMNIMRENAVHSNLNFAAEQFTMHTNCALSYAKTGNYPKSIEHIQQMEALIHAEMSRYSQYKQLLDYAYALYYENTGMYEKALDHCNMSLAHFEEVGYELGIAERLEQKAAILKKMGKTEEAVHVYEAYIKRYKEAQENEYKEHLNTLRAEYNLDKLEMEIEQNQLQLTLTQNKVIGLVAILLFTGIIITIMLLYSKWLKNKNIKLYNQLQDQDKLNNELEEWRSKALISVVASNNDSQEHKEEDGEAPLFVHLRRIMQDEKVYTDSELTRSKLAGMLGTNERYLYDIIKKYTGLNYSDFILSYRLNHARKLLSTNDQNLTIEVVAIDSGFGDRTSFHRHFKAHYGLTPDEYRKLAS